MAFWGLSDFIPGYELASNVVEAGTTAYDWAFGENGNGGAATSTATAPASIASPVPYPGLGGSASGWTNGGGMAVNGNGVPKLDVELSKDPVSGKTIVRQKRRRRRRRRLLTAQDKADIGYLVGILGQGQLGRAAITALLSRRVA